MVHKRLHQMSKNREGFQCLNLGCINIFKILENCLKFHNGIFLDFPLEMKWTWLGSNYLLVSVAKGSKHSLIMEVHILL